MFHFIWLVTFASQKDFPFRWTWHSASFTKTCPIRKRVSNNNSQSTLENPPKMLSSNGIGVCSKDTLFPGSLTAHPWKFTIPKGQNCLPSQPSFLQLPFECWRFNWYLEDHPRYRKYLGSPPFKSHGVQPFGRGPTTPVRGLTITMAY